LPCLILIGDEGTHEPDWEVSSVCFEIELS
jgi:hypothetical protein